MNSRFHRRKIARWNKKVMSMESLGYLTITLPMQVRMIFQTRRALDDLRTYWKRKLIRDGYNKGLCRYHWAGDKSPGKWHPHLNVLIEAKWIHADIIDQWKKDYRKWLSEYTRTEIPVVDIEYHYAIPRWRRKRILRYVTRATLTWYSLDLAIALKGFRNMVAWGNKVDWASQRDLFPDNHEREMTRIDQIQAGICPFTGKKIQWTSKKRAEDVILGNYREVAVSGIYLDAETYQKWKGLNHEP